MGLFDFLLGGTDIHAGIEAYEKADGAVLLDVRMATEFHGGHLPNSINVPLQNLTLVTSKVKKKDTPLYVYCHSGGRSSQACVALRQMGYSNVHNIGGIMSYRGTLEAGNQ